jgi:chemotaxis receptor (MCP) glutamine deamidase CheD
MGPNSFLDFAEKWIVGIGELAVTNDPGVMLATYSLGACVGVTAYDPVAKAGGLLRALLPESRLDPARARECPALFVDTGIPALLRALAPYGAEPDRLCLCLAGGAQFMERAAPASSRSPGEEGCPGNGGATHGVERGFEARRDEPIPNASVRSTATGGMFSLGPRNCAVARSTLAELQIPVRASHTGGPANRSVFLDLATGAVRLRVPGQPDESTLCPG